MEFVEFTAKTVEEAVTEALVALGTTSDKLEYEVIDKGNAGFLGFNSKPAVIKARKKYSMTESVTEFLDGVFKAMKLEVTIEMSFNEEEQTLDVDLKGDDMGVLIGKRGQTLDSLQYLASLVANKESTTYIRVKLDTENYRKRRKTTLENLAKNIAFKVRKTGRPVSLEPMNPYERRIIHSALQNDKYVCTHSEGEEPYRKVIISLKDDAPRPRENRGYGRGGRYGQSRGRSGYGRRDNRNSRYENRSYNEQSSYSAPAANETSSSEE